MTHSPPAHPPSSASWRRASRTATRRTRCGRCAAIWTSCAVSSHSRGWHPRPAAASRCGAGRHDWPRAGSHLPPSPATSRRRARCSAISLRRGERPDDPSLVLVGPRRRRRLPDPVTAEDCTQLLDGDWNDDVRSLRDRAVLELLYGCGLRASEVCALELDVVRPGRRAPAGHRQGRSRAAWSPSASPRARRSTHGSRADGRVSRARPSALLRERPRTPRCRLPTCAGRSSAAAASPESAPARRTR